MSDAVDLVKLINTYNGKLNSVILYGQIVSTMERPINLGSNVSLDPNGQFYKMDLFAINLYYYKTHLKNNGIDNPNSIFMVNGSVIIYADAHNKPLPQFYELQGNLVASKSDNRYISAFKWGKMGNDWIIKASVLSDIELSGWSDSRYKAYIQQSYNVGSIVRPNDVLAMDKFYASPSQAYTMKQQAPIKGSLADTTQFYQNNIKIEMPKNSSFIVQSRKTIEPYSKVVSEFKEVLSKSNFAKDSFLESVKDNYPYTAITSYIVDTIGALSRNFKNKPDFNSMTGKSIIKKYLKSFGKLAEKRYLGTTTTEYLIGIWDEVQEYMLNGTPILASKDALELCTSAFGNCERFYASIVAIICGISQETLADLADNCSVNMLSFSNILNSNPYIFNLLGLSYSDTEHLATCFGFQQDTSLSKFRNIAILNNYCVNGDSGSTIFSVNSLYSANIGLSLSKARYEKVKTSGTFLTPTTMSNIHYYLKDTPSVGMLPKTGYTKKGYSYVLELQSSALKKAIADYIESGLGCKILDSYITSNYYLKRELFIYEKLYNMGKTCFNYDHDEINRLIDEYESNLGFKLEKEQRDAVHLIDFGAAAVTGGAGSGKTTTSDCIVYVLNNLEPNMDIKYATPTGKASKRLQEVVKRPVKTMHSMFKLGIASDNISVLDDEDSRDNDLSIYFFDESAMASASLIYQVLMKISNRSRVYFLGDINQLPPIGKGVPFKDMLRFMPCVRLAVSKRAADGSDITKNSDILNEKSGEYTWEDIKSGKDFFLYECNENNMNRIIVELCKYYLGVSNKNNTELLCKIFNVDKLPEVKNLTPDDIQVVSPLEKSTYTWGAYQLNKVLQPIFNPNRGFDETFIFNTYNKFQIGDRVIHKKKNNYNMQWYGSYEDGTFQKIYGCGICNGDVGKIVAVYPAESCEFLNEIEDEPDEEEFKYPDNLRDDSTWNGYFVVVEYYDYMSNRNFYICYRCDLGSEQNNIGRDLNGDDLSLLDLFYCGTTHKLQGSQAKIIITGLQPVNYSGFITRNMLYTTWTRGINLVFVLGSVGNDKGSMLSRARKDVAGDNIITLGAFL